MACKIFNLSSLGVDDVRNIGQVVVDKLFVASVNQGDEVDDGSSDERETPKWNEFNQPVRDQC